MKKRVVAAMSGGVDSSVAAALLKREGFEVIGITMCFSAVGGSAFGGNLPDSLSKKPACCGIEAIEDARRVAHKLGIRHYVLNMQKALNEYVIKDFCAEYLKGRTPNPCVRCNQFIKFNILLKKALSLGAEYLATGHYARIRVESREHRVRRYLLEKAKDKSKDQSYFLYRMTEQQLKHTLFPLGSLFKSEVRRIAQNLGLAVADKLDSQEICFLPNADYRQFLEKQTGIKIKPGLVIDKEGGFLGEHKGIAFYTIGQRQGLGIAKGYPLYVTKIDAKTNRITVGVKEEALEKEFLVKEPHFILKPIKKKIVVRVKIRYNHQEEQAGIEILPSGKLRVRLKKPQFAVTPGQSAVFYDKATLVGGGIIDEVLC